MFRAPLQSRKSSNMLLRLPLCAGGHELQREQKEDGSRESQSTSVTDAATLDTGQSKTECAAAGRTFQLGLSWRVFLTWRHHHSHQCLHPTHSWCLMGCSVSAPLMLSSLVQALSTYITWKLLLSTFKQHLPRANLKALFFLFLQRNSGQGMPVRPCCRYSITRCPVLRWELNGSLWKKCLSSVPPLHTSLHPCSSTLNHRPSPLSRSPDAKV